MREIKFRGKRVDNGEFVYGYLLNGYYEGILKLLIQSEVVVDKFPLYEVTPESVGQFTGYKDKNGIDIYDGDILQLPKRDIIAQVEWRQDGAQFELISVRENRFVQLVYSIGYTHNGEKVEVIGNVHENKELISKVHIS